jgi:hypothetical protein
MGEKKNKSINKQKVNKKSKCRLYLFLNHLTMHSLNAVARVEEKNHMLRGNVSPFDYPIPLFFFFYLLAKRISLMTATHPRQRNPHPCFVMGPP